MKWQLKNNTECFAKGFKAINDFFSQNMEKDFIHLRRPQNASAMHNITMHTVDNDDDDTFSGNIFFFKFIYWQ